MPTLVIERRRFPRDELARLLVAFLDAIATHDALEVAGVTVHGSFLHKEAPGDLDLLVRTGLDLTDTDQRSLIESAFQKFATTHLVADGKLHLVGKPTTTQFPLEAWFVDDEDRLAAITAVGGDAQKRIQETGEVEVSLAPASSLPAKIAALMPPASGAPDPSS